MFPKYFESVSHVFAVICHVLPNTNLSSKKTTTISHRKGRITRFIGALNFESFRSARQAKAFHLELKMIQRSIYRCLVHEFAPDDITKGGIKSKKKPLPCTTSNRSSISGNGVIFVVIRFSCFQSHSRRKGPSFLRTKNSGAA